MPLRPEGSMTVRTALAPAFRPPSKSACPMAWVRVSVTTSSRSPERSPRFDSSTDRPSSGVTARAWVMAPLPAPSTGGAHFQLRPLQAHRGRHLVHRRPQLGAMNRAALALDPVPHSVAKDRAEAGRVDGQQAKQLGDQLIGPDLLVGTPLRPHGH